MDILAGVSSEWLRALTWIAAGVVGAGLLVWRPRRPDLALLASVVVFMAASVGAGIYVLNHLGDGRWGGDAQAKLSPPPLSDAPVVGDFLEPLEGLLGSVTDGVNEFVDFRSALPVALDFFAAAGWALALSVPAALVVLVGNARATRRRNAEFAAYKTETEQLRDELNRVKRHVGYPADDIF
ncbi:hypothetical protein [Pseudarthrobacter phenanthrenivorans]|uniref:hypothetical protein n=1 Tax=Pseudarthrobacter phenanthrenivorans TaxID=361575 RepID=UPI0005A1E81D|nr:hypothetical protein [Pseudarthrobacter phenanthrenivorans]